jgi:hypothetical protein
VPAWRDGIIGHRLTRVVDGTAVSIIVSTSAHEPSGDGLTSEPGHEIVLTATP